ncbi:hypothetical protein BAUCODRAFT_70750 [Baudoinia panamericana UAMH 10762]|uniref:F-box domain-containing protein n=1 Tax=Baudoinia panamericana (strain UAMH 10762) TaxID=717646 RepID=M2NBM7_BAUPA|nr:uncharacterized protein BAUCODRAFT_70750 [Baudoinia panamericana UAMH 10762]EMC96549.1 hypothetical protein BAUCODRAFT_70750 [Baudoinia panamericana UAMH 10762]
MARPGNKRRSTRQAATKRSIYTEPDSDDDYDLEQDAEAEYEPEQPLSLPFKRAKTVPRTRHVTRSKSTPATRTAAKAVVKAVGRPRRRNTAGEPLKKEFTGPSDRRIPDWTSLPIDILREVLAYASLPRHEQTRTASANVAWLLNAARVCRAFALPALEAYYQAPSLLTNLQPHHLLELLRMEKKYTNYNAKVKSLFVDVRRLAYSAPGKGLFDMSQLIPHLPQLHHVEIFHPIDEPPFRRSHQIRWQYPRDLFDTLAKAGTKLKTWRWHRAMLPFTNEDELCSFITQTHISTPYQSLAKLTFCDFNGNGEGEITGQPSLAIAISLLPSLVDLTFVSSEVVVDRFLEHMPKTLERLELTNCLELTSDMLHDFLATGASRLRELILNHNPALNLAFTTGLKVLCPKLEVLSMNLRYYSERVNSDDSKPLYENLLTNDEVPQWPSSLRRLELIHLQRWSAEAAQNLFRSLLVNAAELPDLRYLILHSHINIPWRQRADFRDNWIDRLQRVFACRADPPNPHLDITFGRNLSHVEISPAKTSAGDTEVFSDSSPERQHHTDPIVRRSRRVAQAKPAPAVMQLNHSEQQDDEDDEEEEEEEEEQGTEDFFIQGLCDLVDIRIDNQRPRENQFTEGDFLDSEVSGDEDWREGNDIDDEDGYAW